MMKVAYLEAIQIELISVSKHDGNKKIKLFLRF